MNPPEPDEIEVSIFGRGSGESVVIHTGSGKWIVIDSLLSSKNTPVPLDYLSGIGVKPSDVEAILLTHWHDDHIAGSNLLVVACSEAIVAIPASLQNDEFLGFVETVDPTGSDNFSSGVDELRAVLKTLTSRSHHPRYSAAERRISGGPTSPYEFEALSPSDADITEFLSSIKTWLHTQAIGGRLLRPLRNDSSVAAVVSIADNLILLGADLEVTSPTNRGWACVHDSAWKSRGRASFLKIPHHGSKNAHFEPMWKNMLEPNAYAGLAPFNKNKGLPTSDDVRRILDLTPNAFAASRPVSRKALKRMASVDRIVKTSGIELTREPNDLGHARFRKKICAPADWQVELFGVGACPLEDLLAA